MFPFASLPVGSDFGTYCPALIKVLHVSQNLMNGYKRDLHSFTCRRCVSDWRVMWQKQWVLAHSLNSANSE